MKLMYVWLFWDVLLLSTTDIKRLSPYLISPHSNGVTIGCNGAELAWITSYQVIHWPNIILSGISPSFKVYLWKCIVLAWKRLPQKLWSFMRLMFRCFCVNYLRDRLNGGCSFSLQRLTKATLSNSMIIPNSLLTHYVIKMRLVVVFYLGFL